MRNGLNNQRVRHHNKTVLMALLYRQKVASKSTLARQSQLSIPAVSKILDDLLSEGRIVWHKINLHQRGLSGGSYQVAPDNAHILCMNITPYRIESIVVDSLIRPQNEFETLSIKIKTPDELLQHIEQIYHQCYARRRLPLKLALSVHGQVNPISGVSQKMPQAPWSGTIEFKYLLESRLNTDVMLDNDCIMLALAEKWQNASSQQDFCVINVDYGIGSSFVINQQIYRGSLYGSGQIGHTIIDPDGSACSCGRYGCLETIASLSALKRKVRMMLKIQSHLDEHEWAELTTEQLINLYQQNNDAVRALVIQAAQAIGLSLYNFLNTLNINRIHLYGRSCQFGDEWFNTILNQIGISPFDQTERADFQATQIMLGQLTRQQQVMGIGYLFVEKALKEINES